MGAGSPAPIRTDIHCNPLTSRTSARPYLRAGSWAGCSGQAGLGWAGLGQGGSSAPSREGSPSASPRRQGCCLDCKGQSAHPARITPYGLEEADSAARPRGCGTERGEGRGAGNGAEPERGPPASRHSDRVPFKASWPARRRGGARAGRPPRRLLGGGVRTGPRGARGGLQVSGRRARPSRPSPPRDWPPALRPSAPRRAAPAARGGEAAECGLEVGAARPRVGVEGRGKGGSRSTGDRARAHRAPILPRRVIGPGLSVLICEMGWLRGTGARGHPEPEWADLGKRGQAGGRGQADGDGGGSPDLEGRRCGRSLWWEGQGGAGPLGGKGTRQVQGRRLQSPRRKSGLHWVEGSGKEGWRHAEERAEPRVGAARACGCARATPAFPWN
jgi:hypothetical protein